MPVYAFQALTLSGEVRQGKETASSVEELRSILASRDLILKHARSVIAASPSIGRKAPLSHIASFNREFTVLLKAGIPAAEALAMLALRPGCARLERALVLVLEEVRSGAALSEAARKVGAFDKAYCAVIATGERSGTLPESLEQFQKNLQLRLRVRAQIGKALVYPTVLMATLAAVLVFLFVEVIPNFASMYRSLGSNLPGPTRVLVAIAGHLPVMLLAIAAAAIAVIILDLAWKRTTRGQIQRHAFLLRLPLLGRLRRAVAAAETARMLSTLIAAGAPVSQALAVVSDTVHDRHFAQALTTVNRSVREGAGLSAAMAQQALFPAISLNMLSAGEASGSLDRMLAEIANHHDDELERDLARFTTLIEPALTLFSGVVVGLVIVAMYLPIFSLTELVK